MKSHIVHRSLKKAGIKSKYASFHNRKTKTNTEIAHEHKTFHSAQKFDSVLSQDLL